MMTPRTPWIVAALTVFALCLWALVTGAPLLDHLLPGGLPLGNLLSAAGLCALPFIAFLLAPPGGKARKYAAFSLALAVAWLPVSLAMAGNLQLNFSNGLGTVWWTATLAIFALGVVAPLFAVVARMRRR